MTSNVLHVIANLNAVRNTAIASAIILSVYQNVMVARAAQTNQSIVAQKISSFINCQGTNYTIQVIKCQKQSGCNDCGLFAIATATALCHGELPSSKIWDQRPPSKLF